MEGSDGIVGSGVVARKTEMRRSGMWDCRVWGLEVKDSVSCALCAAQRARLSAMSMEQKSGGGV